MQDGLLRLAVALPLDDGLDDFIQPTRAAYLDHGLKRRPQQVVVGMDRRVSHHRHCYGTDPVRG